MRTRISKARRLVVKVGSALVTNNGEGLAVEALADWARQIAALVADGRQVVLVSSGAIAAGMQRLGWTTRPHEMHQLQAAAAVGQMGLAQAYESVFAQNGLHTAQILLTHADLADRTRYLNARSTLITLLELGVVPIINENDTVVTDEIKFGDNDTLGALVANLIDAEALIILTDQQGLYTADPRKDPSATLIGEERAENTALEAMAGGAGTGISKGGMITKVRAAQRAARRCALMLVVGTAGAVYPAAGLAHLARDAGARVVIVNPHASELDPVAHAVLRGTAAQLLPLLLAPESMLPQSVGGPSGA